ncbi:hypothetical protein GCM10023113_20110 [Cellulomonas oligotrophica]|uniref:Transposase IS204/IS1001/IS1096/IS1165 DDE domain-containing protein n=1 Tax=Cellulomonas oligotrophica TaxID=931536 RepID=A0ABQ4DFK2_9CELL|nr:hypothetical protein Col01nite_36670 [Cellulomonas oligotrophica]
MENANNLLHVNYVRLDRGCTGIAGLAKRKLTLACWREPRDRAAVGGKEGFPVGLRARVAAYQGGGGMKPGAVGGRTAQVSFAGGPAHAP